MEIIKNNAKSVTINVINQGEMASMISNALINQHPVCWSNGTLFSFEPYPLTEWTAKEAAAGHIYYFSLTHCKMDKFVSELSDGSNNKVPVLNLDHHSFWKEVLANV